MKGVFATFLFFVCAFSYQSNAGLRKCNDEETIICPENYQDGCLVKNPLKESLTTHHVCVKNGAAKKAAYKCGQILPLFRCTYPEISSCNKELPVSDWKLCFRMPIINNPP